LHTYPINFEKSSVNGISSPNADISAIKKASVWRLMAVRYVTAGSVFPPGCKESHGMII